MTDAVETPALTEEPASIIAQIDVAELEREAHMRMTNAMRRMMSMGAPPTQGMAVAIECMSQLLIQAGVFTRLDILTAQANYAENAADQALTAKITQDVANGIAKAH